MTLPSSHAFPNAYLETDETPNHALREKILALVGIIGLLTFGLLVTVLHFEPTGYNAIRQAVSDYAVGQFGRVMSIAFIAGGIGVTALGLASTLPESEPRKRRAGGALFLVAGVALVLVSVFPTDLEGAPATFHGTMRNALSQVVFTFGPIGILLVSYSSGWKWFLVTLTGYLSTGPFSPPTSGWGWRQLDLRNVSSFCSSSAGGRSHAF